MKKVFLSLGIIAACASLFACGVKDKSTDDPGEKPGGGNPPVVEPGDDDPPSPEPGGFPEKEPEEGEVAVSFNAGSGKFSNGKTIVRVAPDEDGKALFTEQPLYDGCAFDGWYSGEVKYDPQAAYESGAEFTAHYAEGKKDGVYTALFDTGSVVTVEINMSDAEWKKLNHDFTVNNKSDIYRLADNVKIGITAGGKTLTYYYEEVGVRLKGNTSRHEFYGNDGFYAPSHFKLSFKQTFDDTGDGYNESELKVWEDADARKARKKRTLGGMEKIDIKYNYTHDETYSKESYAMKLFRDNDIYAPRVSLCAVKALNKNGSHKNLGVYTLHECVDEAFILRDVEEGDAVGDLYKCTWGSGEGASLTSADDRLIGVENVQQYRFYTYDLKTNKKKSTHADIKNFIQKANDYSSDLSEVLDTDYFARFEAVNYLLGNPDCIRNHYNNYYLYFRKSDSKAIIIPYDYDRCLGITYGWDPKGNGMTGMEPFTRQTTNDDNTQNNPLYKRLIVKNADPAAMAVYEQYLRDISQDNAFSAATFNAYAANYKNKYSSYVNGAIGGNEVAFDSHSGNWSFESYINAKLNTMRNALENYSVLN